MTSTENVKLVRRGDELLLVLDESLLRDLQIDTNTLLRITTDGESLVISPVDPKRQETFRKAAEDTFEKYPDMLRRLAQ